MAKSYISSEPKILKPNLDHRVWMGSGLAKTQNRTETQVMYKSYISYESSIKYYLIGITNLQHIIYLLRYIFSGFSLNENHIQTKIIRVYKKQPNLNLKLNALAQDTWHGALDSIKRGKEVIYYYCKMMKNDKFRTGWDWITKSCETIMYNAYNL